MTKGTELVIAERQKQLDKERNIEYDIAYNKEEQLSSFIRLLTHNIYLGNNNKDIHLKSLIYNEKSNNVNFDFNIDTLLRYMNKPYIDRIRIAGALCIAELDRILK